MARKGARGRRLPPKRVYQLKITISNIRPPVWRRVLVESHATLGDLHLVIQRLFDWENYHLHDFTIGGGRYGDDWDDQPADLICEHDVLLCDLGLVPKAKFDYLYDFGDGWEHKVLVEAELDPEEGVEYPVCVRGRRAGPPEDCGGPWGYARMLASLADPEDGARNEIVDWLGEPFDPDEFNIHVVNALLRAGRQGET